MATQWMQSGKSPGQIWYEEDYDCNTGFKSEVIVRNNEGMPRTLDRITTSEGTTEFVYPQVGNGDKVFVKVKTLGDDSKAKSDRVTVSLTALNMSYMMNEMRKLLDTKTPEEQDRLIQNTNALVEELLPLISPASMMVNVRSRTLETDSNGMLETEFYIEDDWPPGPLYLDCHYGYSASAERSDFEKALEFYMEDILPLVVDLALAIGMVALSCGATFGAGCVVGAAASWALLSAEIAWMFHRIKQDAYGFIDTNKYSCRFPVPGGFNHTYTIDVVQAMGDKLAPIIRASPALTNAGEKASSNPSVQSYTTRSLSQSSSNPNNQIILVMVMLFGAYFILGGEQ